jgi:hypothetical protein
MPSDASIYSQANQPSTALLNPLDIQARKNALALQGQQLQGGTMTLQQQAQAIADQHANRAALTSYYNPQPQANALAPAPAGAPSGPVPVPGPAAGAMPAAAPPAGGPPGAPSAPGPVAAAPQAPPPPVQRPRVPTIGELIGKGATPEGAAGMVAQFQKIDETSATIDKTRQDTNDLIGQQASDMANMLVKNTPAGQPINPTLLAWHLQHFASLGAVQQQQAQQIGQQLAQLSPADQVTMLKTIAGTPKTLEANATTDTAASKVTEVGNLTRKTDSELADKAYQNGVSALAPLSTKEDYAAQWMKLTPQQQADSRIPNPAAWTPKTGALMQQQALSAQEQVTTAEAATHNAALEANERMARNQEQQRIGQAQAEFKLKYGGGDGSDIFSRLSPASQLISKQLQTGDFNPALLGRFPDKEAILGAAIQGAAKNGINWTPQIYATQKAFTDPASQQAQNLGTISRIVGHIGRFETNSKEVGTSVLYGAGVNLGGTANATAEDAHAISGELEKLNSGGVGSEGLIKSWQASLRSTFPGVRQKAIDEISQLVGSQYKGMAQTYKTGTGGMELPVDKFLSPEGQEWMKAKGIAIGSGAAPAAGAPQGSVSVTDPTGGVHVFPNAAAAQSFKTSAGIK